MPQYRVAGLAGIREGRLCHLLRHGGATQNERAALSQVLKADEAALFSPLLPSDGGAGRNHANQGRR